MNASADRSPGPRLIAARNLMIGLSTPAFRPDVAVVEAELRAAPSNGTTMRTVTGTMGDKKIDKI